MYKLEREISFCYGHRLLDYDGKCKNLHGHNGIAIIRLEAEGLDQLGMVEDFSVIKKILGTWIDDNLDHKLLLHEKDPVLPTLKQMNEAVFVMDVNPTAENIAKLIFEQAASHGLPVVEVILSETPNCRAAYSKP